MSTTTTLKKYIADTGIILAERKCSLNNAYRVARTTRSTNAELRIVYKVTYNSTIERLADPKLSVKAIERERRRQLTGLLSIIKRVRLAKKLSIHHNTLNFKKNIVIHASWVNAATLEKQINS